jgi:predicted ATPase
MVLGVLRGDITAVARTSKALIELSLQHGVPLFRAIGEIYSSWARGRLGDPEAGARELRASLAAYLGFGGTLNVPLFHGLLAELEARAQSANDALVHIDEGLALARRTGQHASDALLHRLRGDILLLDPMNFAPAEDAFQTAIVIARRQKARSLQLQAALPLARLYQSNARPADACAVLAPALEGFSPTPELPQIAEAQSLLAAVS